MSIQGAYRRMPDYLAVPLAFLASVVVALTFAAIGGVTLGFLLDKVHRSDDLGDAILVIFFAAPSIAVLAFVFCFSILINWHHSASWRAPTFAFALGGTLLWAWAHDWIGILSFMPGSAAWLLSCWFLHRNARTHPQHAIQA